MSATAGWKNYTYDYGFLWQLASREDWEEEAIATVSVMTYIEEGSKFTFSSS